MSELEKSMGCDEARQAMLLADSNELSSPDRAAFERHVQYCATCAGDQRVLVQLMTRAKAPALHPGPTTTTMQMLRTEMWNVAGHRQAARRLRRMALAAAAILLVAVTFGWWHGAGRPVTVGGEPAMASLVGVAVEFSESGATVPHPSAGTATPGSVDDLANQLMILEGLSEETGGLEFMEPGDEALPSTDLQSHSTFALPSRRCV